MVNPNIFPAQRRGPSGPFAASSSSGSGSDFEPFDNEIYFDPNYSGGAENGSIAGPFLNWADWIAAVNAGSDSYRVMIPGVPIFLPGPEPLPMAIGRHVNIDGVGANGDEGSSFLDVVTIDLLASSLGASITFSRMHLEAIDLNGGDYDIHFRQAQVADINESSGSYTGSVVGEFTDFLIGQVIPDGNFFATGGTVNAIQAASLTLTNLLAGDGSAATLEATGEIIICRGVTFFAGTTIEFLGAAGQLWLDPASYRSFIDSGTTLINGHITRDDGSWPVDSAIYTPGTTPIDWAANPRAILNIDSSFTCSFLPGLTREYQLIVIQDGSGGHVIEWSANILWSDGDEPVQDTSPDSISVYRFDYEESITTYFGWVVGMNMQTVP